MKNHFYAVFGTYLPNAAATNRLLSYLEAWSRMDLEVTVVFAEPDRMFSRLNSSYKNITVTYLWDVFSTRVFLFHKMMLFWYVKTFLKKLHTGDCVYVYGEPFLVKQILRKRPDVRLYQERTEHPMVYLGGYWPYRVSLNSYLQDCKKLNGLIVISQQLKDYFVSSGVDSEKMHIVNMTVDSSRFVNVTKQEQSNKYIAYCGKASNSKDGVDQLIKAFSLVSKKYPDLFLYIMGPVPHKDDVNSNAVLAETLGIAHRVKFTGIIPFSDMPQMLTNATVLALDRPDNLQAQNGFPTKLGEYLLSGNPVVVTRVGDIPRFIEDGISGMVAEPSNPEDFSSKIIWLLEHPDEAIAIGKKGRMVAEKNFNNEIEAKKIVDIIFSV